MNHQAFIALGSNLQDPLKQVRQAFSQLAAIPKIQLKRQSSLYRTAPLGYDDQPAFINAVAEVATGLEPIDLLQKLIALESMSGRQRSFANAPRVLDLDLLLYDDQVMQTFELTLPHPRMCERGFVLFPLAEIAPDLEVPGKGRINQMLQACSNQNVEKFR